MGKRRCFVVILCVAFLFSGCSRAPLNPPRLVVSTDTDMSIQLFMQATILLANYYGYTDISYAEVRARTRKAGLDSLPFMAPESVRATPDLVNLMNKYEDDPAQLAAVVQRIGGYRNLVKYYVRTGLRASQSICRSYLLDLDEKSEYLDFIEKEVGVGYALSTAVLALVHANTTLTTSFLIARTGIDGAVGVYQDYRYLSIDREAARALVEAAQNAYAQYFLQQVDATVANSNLVTGGYTFSDALHAVSTIEYQCTRSGIKALLARSINNSPTNLMIDQATGTISFISAAGSPVNPNPLGGVTNNGGQSGIVIPPGAGQPQQPRQPRPQPVATPTPAPTATPTPRPGPANLDQLDPGLAQACQTPGSPTGTAICNFITKDPNNNVVKANIALQRALRENPLNLPSNTTLAAVISGTAPPFEVARKAMRNGPELK
jgi:hypothetical protein